MTQRRTISVWLAPIMPPVFYPDQWQYLLACPLTWTTFWCRWRYHPAGPIFYNPNGLEPDDRCRNCGDHIG